MQSDLLVQVILSMSSDGDRVERGITQNAVRAILMSK